MYDLILIYIYCIIKYIDIYLELISLMIQVDKKLSVLFEGRKKYVQKCNII